MRITIVLPFLAMTGGTRVLVEYANGLADRGHEVTLAYPWHAEPPRTARQRLKGTAKRAANLLGRALGTPELRWAPVRARLRAVRALEPRHLPDADVLLASENRTIDPLSAFPPSKGARVYLIQGYETWSRAADRVDATWRAPGWRKVVVSSWLAELASARFGVRPDVVLNGIDLRAFHPGGRGSGAPPRVLALYHDLEEKGTRDVLAAMARVREEGIAFQPVFFGTRRPGSALRAIPGAEYHRFPRGERLRRLYAGADVFVSGSWNEGFGLTPLEAMACGAAVVATRVGAVPDYAVPGETGLVVEPRRPDELAGALARVLRDRELRERLGARGAARAREFGIGRAVAGLEAILLEEAERRSRSATT